MEIGSDKAEVKRAEEIYNQIIGEAAYIPGDAGGDICPEDIQWANPELIQRGQEFVLRNYFSVILAHLCALLYGFSFKRLTTVLLRTGGFGLGEPHTSLLRHIQTTIHIHKWYSTNVLDRQSKAYMDIQFVRKFHFGSLRKCMKTPLRIDEDVPGKDSKLSFIAATKSDLDACGDTREAEMRSELFTYHPQLLFSQFDMLMTQFGFISIIFLFPERLGIRDTSGRDGFLHLGAIFGRLLGIEDRFNLALNPNTTLLLKLFHNVGIPGIKGMDPTILHLGETYINGAYGHVKSLVSLKSILYYGLATTRNNQLPGFKGEQFKRLLSVSDKIRVGIIRMTVFFLFHFDVVRKVLNKLQVLLSNYLERKYFLQKRT